MGQIYVNRIFTIRVNTWLIITLLRNHGVDPRRSTLQARVSAKWSGVRGVHHGGVSGSALACGACNPCWRPGFESRVKRASQFKKSQTAVSTTERQFTLSVVCLIVECTKDSLRVTKKNIQIVVGRLGWKWIGRSVLQLLLLKQREVELLLLL